MRIAVTGSIATDHLATFPGRFTDQLVADRLDRVSLSFLVDDLDIRRGGVAANISYGLGRLGLTPLLLGAVGPDFGAYRSWLEENGVDTGFVHVSEKRQTARFMCTTDLDQNQIASFYGGAMAEALGIDLAPVAARLGGLDLVLVSPNEPRAMLRHTAQCHDLGIDFAADPSQQLTRLEPEETRTLVDGARWLFTNEYEAAVLCERTGWRQSEVLDHVGVWVITLGAEGARLLRAGGQVTDIPAVPVTAIADPTGAGDAFRAGFLAAVGWRLPEETAARLGCALAALALEAVGPQDYTVTADTLLGRIRGAYGRTAAAALAPHLERSS